MFSMLEHLNDHKLLCRLVAWQLAIHHNYNSWSRLNLREDRANIKLQCLFTCRICLLNLLDPRPVHFTQMYEVGTELLFGYVCFYFDVYLLPLTGSHWLSIVLWKQVSQSISQTLHNCFHKCINIKVPKHIVTNLQVKSAPTGGLIVPMSKLQTGHVIN